MTADPSRRGRSSTSRPRPSGRSRPSAPGSSTSNSVGEDVSPGLGAARVRSLAARHGVHPAKALGQHFLIDPNLARAIASDAGVEGGDHVVEVGSGLGSLTVALAETGASVRAIEIDPALVGALREVVEGIANIEVIEADAMALDWPAILHGADRWILCANLPYNIAVPLVLDVLRDAPTVRRLVVTVQREVGERLAASPGEEAFGAVSLRVAYRASARLVRRVPPSVFWPRPKVDSVVVRSDRRTEPPVAVDERRLWRVVDAGFAQRRKTMRNALRRLGLDADAAEAILRESGVGPDARAESLDLPTFAAIAERIPP